MVGIVYVLLQALILLSHLIFRTELRMDSVKETFGQSCKALQVCPYYDSRIVNFKRKLFIKLATGIFKISEDNLNFATRWKILSLRSASQMVQAILNNLVWDISLSRETRDAGLILIVVLPNLSVAQNGILFLWRNISKFVRRTRLNSEIFV